MAPSAVRFCITSSSSSWITSVRGITKAELAPQSVLTAKMRTGDFSELLAGSTPIQLYDPLNNNAPYANNQGVPILNPVASS